MAIKEYICIPFYINPFLIELNSFQNKRSYLRNQNEL